MLPCTWWMKLSRTITATDYRSVSFTAKRASLWLVSKSGRVWRNVTLTAVHLWRATAFKPSTKRSRVASVKVNSWVKTAQRTCAHPRPSVGLHARRKVSARGYGFLFFSSFVALGQRRQSGFWECRSQESSLTEVRSYYRRFQGLLIFA